MSSSGRLVGLLTGTFDPVHLGHVAMARVAMRVCGLDEVWFLVNPEPGHKVGVIPFEDRLAMAKLAVADEPGLSVYSGVFADKPHNIDVFLTLINAHSEDRFVFVLGADVLSGVRAWSGYERVVQEARFVVARRKAVPDPELDSRLRVRWFDLDEHVGASSRDIRWELARGVRPADLNERVYDYIRRQGLYGVSAAR